MMRIMKFPARFLNLIMGCNTTTSYSLLLQGRPYGKIISSRGLCQWDPISSYLLQQAELNSKIRGVSISASAPSLNHLFFAYDILLFYDAEPRQVTELKRYSTRWFIPLVFGYLKLNVDGALDLRDDLRRVVEFDSLAIVRLLSKEEECLALEGVLVTEIGAFS
ncbi:unnamed protein product [Prunus brigantina]